MMSTRRGNVNMTKPKFGNRERRSPKRTKTPSSNELKNKCKFSPKGKRKLDFQLKGKKPGPLVGKLFYLDLNGSSYSTQLKKTIERLGGTIEEFFRKEVTYLVTNRGDCGKSPSSQSVPSPGTPSPLPMTRSSSVKNYTAVSPMSTDSPQGLDSQNQVPKATIRGKSIAQRSAGFKKGTSCTDILTNAATWGVNVVHVDIVKRWISQLMMKAPQQQNASRPKTSSPSKRVSQTKLPKVVSLQETYVKVEDLSFKYRPLLHEFKIWPQLAFDNSNVCPFDPPRRRSSENSNTKRKCADGSVKKPQILERPKHGYCECCEDRYADLDMHLRGKQHKEFAMKDSNYISLDKAINGGPKIEDLLKEIRFMKSNCSSPGLDKSNLLVSSENTDEVFLVSTPRSSQRNKTEGTTEREGNVDNIKEHQKASPGARAGEGCDNIEGTYSTAKSCTSSAKRTIADCCLSNTCIEEMKSPKSGRKAFSSSSPSENQHLPSSRREKRNSTGNSLKHIKDTGKMKRKSIEAIEKCNEVVQVSKNKHDNVPAVLEAVKNEHSPRRTTRRTLANLSTKSSEKGSEAQIQLSGNNHIITCTGRTEKSAISGKVSGHDLAVLVENGKQYLSSNLISNFSKQPKRKCVTKIKDCTETSESIEKLSEVVLKIANSEKNEGEVEKCSSSVDGKMGINESTNSCQGVTDEGIHILDSKKKQGNCNYDFSATNENEQHSHDPPRLNTPSKNISDQHRFEMCPGALTEEKNTMTVKSARRRKSVVAECKLSPIPPCNLGGEYSVRSSCSEGIEFLPSGLPSGLRVYSSFGSSLDGVSKEINHLVHRIAGEFHTDGDNDKDDDVDGDVTLVDVKSIEKEFSEEHSYSTRKKNTAQGKKTVDDIEFSLTCTKDNDCSVNIKRKRIEDEEQDDRQCKRLSVASDSFPDDSVDCMLTSEDKQDITFRSSVAERVKLQRAINESLEGLNSPNTSVAELLSSPQVQCRGRKRKTVLQSSPFAEITNTCKKRRERAKSESRVRKTTRLISRQNRNNKKQPRSACLTPNDPFRFDDY